MSNAITESGSHFLLVDGHDSNKIPNFKFLTNATS